MTELTPREPDFESSDQLLPAARLDYEFVSNNPNDDVEVIQGTIARGQEALNKILDNIPSLLFGAARGKIAESVARAQSTLSEAQARILELALKKKQQEGERERKMRELAIAETEKAEQQKLARADALATGIVKISEGAEQLARAGLSKADIKKVVFPQIEALREQLKHDP